MMKFWQVDAFTNTPFTGNPAAVFILDDDIPALKKQIIANEMNLSETVFVLLGKNPSITWFTPEAEVDLCGHATLGSAHILWSEGFIERPNITFNSKSGPPSVSQQDTNFYTLNFPSRSLVSKPEYYPFVTNILGYAPTFIGATDFFCVAAVENTDLVYSAQLDNSVVSMLREQGFLLTSRDQSSQYDYIYRAFFPKIGIAEDPVTGSANTVLAPYWANILQKEELIAYQASRRGGLLKVGVSDQRVLISGAAITIFEGTMRV